MVERIDAICDLLLAAAYADQRFDPSEKEAIKTILCAIQGTETLEPRLAARISFTKPETIDVMETAAVFENDSEDNRRLLMQLVLAVNEADGEYDIEEDEMAIFIAGALGFNTAEIQEFAMSIDSAPDLLRNS